MSFRLQAFAAFRQLFSLASAGSPTQTKMHGIKDNITNLKTDTVCVSVNQFLERGCAVEMQLNQLKLLYKEEIYTLTKM